MYQALVTTLKNVRKDPNSDKLYLAECFGEGVIINSDMCEGETVLYLPSDGKIERWFGDSFNLFRKNLDGTEQGGYVDNNGHIRAIKLRGNQSSGIVLPYSKIIDLFGELGWKDGDKVTEINGKEFCSKYIPVQKTKTYIPSTSYKGKKAEGIVYPEFSMHSDTEQLAYNLQNFRPGDVINLSLKMHGTSQRSMKTYAEMPKGFFRRLLKLKPKTKDAYVCGTRRCIIHENFEGFYGNDQFRIEHHKKLEPFIEEGMEVFYEVVGYYGPNETDTIMPIGDNTKVNDKNFIKEFGKQTIFSYGCVPGQSKIYVYRITANNGEYEYSPAEIISWCNKAGVDNVPYISTFMFTTVEELQNKINKYFEDLRDPIGKTHIKEGVVVRVLNNGKWKAYKSKTYEFKMIEGLIKDTTNSPDMEEAQEILEETNK